MSGMSEYFGSLEESRGGSSESNLYRLEGKSMRPAMNDGDMLLIGEVAVSSLRIGDVIAFYSRSFEKTVIHRIIGFRNDGSRRLVITRGDSSSRVDEPVRPEDIIGRVSVRIHNGKIVPFGRFSGMFWLNASAVLRTARRGARWLALHAAPGMIPFLRKTCLCDWMKK